MHTQTQKSFFESQKCCENHEMTACIHAAAPAQNFPLSHHFENQNQRKLELQTIYRRIRSFTIREKGPSYG